MRGMRVRAGTWKARRSHVFVGNVDTGLVTGLPYTQCAPVGSPCWCGARAGAAFAGASAVSLDAGLGSWADPWQSLLPPVTCIIPAGGLDLMRACSGFQSILLGPSVPC